MISLRFRLFLTLSLWASPCGAFSRTESTAIAEVEPAPIAAPPGGAAVAEPTLQWFDVTTWGVEGRAWPDLERKNWFDRLPARAQATVTPGVWNRSRDSAGMLVHFKTDAAMIWADYTLSRETLSGPNTTQIGGSGLDLYVRNDSGHWRWVGVTRPTGLVVRQKIIGDLAPGLREYAVYLPLLNGLKALSLGVPPEARFEPGAPRADRPIVFYGTSITQGVGASRPGMTHAAILGRRLGRPVVNLGFSGNGRMDAEIGELLCLIDAAVYVIDCLPNMSPRQVRERCLPMVQQLRAARPDTPILLVEDRRNTNAWILPARDRHHTDNHAALRACFAQLQAAGVQGLFYLSGDELLGADGEASVDGSHPSDLGFWRQADVFEPVLRAALQGR